nr:aminotransferase class V-fold PLP-dependent enzyme [Candidatus Bipolaricaulota bacterium]
MQRKGRSLLMIPGPIEFEPEVLQALGAPTTSHVSAGFIETFGRVLEQMRDVWFSPSGKPFVLAGSGTLAMDMAGANLIESGDRALVLVTGVFGERFVDLLERYGAEVTALRAPVGKTVEMSKVEEALAAKTYKVMTLTHVDTSTGVRSDARAFGELGRRHDVLTVLDGVCSVAGEEIRQDKWGIDVVLTASQKAIGVPPGLALLVASPRALEAFGRRVTPVQNYYADWQKW